MEEWSFQIWYRYAEVAPANADTEKWCSCIDGALIKEHSINCIRQAGFQNVEVLSKQLYTVEDGDGNQVNDKGQKKKKSSSWIQCCCNCCTGLL